MNAKYAALIISIVLAGILAILIIKECSRNPVPQSISSRSVVAVTPITDRDKLDKLPPLPGGEKPVVAIPVAIPTSKPGYVVRPSVVISDAGNTFVVFSEGIDWGLRFDPKISCALSNELLAGIDITFFMWWRIGADILAYIPISGNNIFERTRIGFGASIQVTPNTSAGAACLWDFEDKKSFAIFAAIKL